MPTSERKCKPSRTNWRNSRWASLAPSTEKTACFSQVLRLWWSRKRDGLYQTANISVDPLSFGFPRPGLKNNEKNPVTHCEYLCHNSDLKIRRTLTTRTTKNLEKDERYRLFEFVQLLLVLLCAVRIAIVYKRNPNCAVRQSTFIQWTQILRSGKMQSKMKHEQPQTFRTVLRWNSIQNWWQILKLGLEEECFQRWKEQVQTEAKAFHLSANRRWITSPPIISMWPGVFPLITVISAES